MLCYAMRGHRGVQRQVFEVDGDVLLFQVVTYRVSYDGIEEEHLHHALFLWYERKEP